MPIWSSVLCLCAVSMPVAQQKGPGRYVETLTVGSTTRSYVLRIPKSYTKNKPTPVVMVYHGFTASAPIMELYTRIGELGEREGFITVLPDGIGKPQGWNAGFIDLTGLKADDIGFTKAMLDALPQQVNVDSKRIYVWGHSNGAMMAYRLGAVLGDRLAAVAGVAGTIGLPLSDGGKRLIENAVAPIPVMLIHGKMDKTVAYDSKDRALLKGIGAKESAQWWAAQNGCKPQPRLEKDANGLFETETFSGGKNGSEVVLISTTNGSHDIPGSYRVSGQEKDGGFVAIEKIWEFFKRHPKKR